LEPAQNLTNSSVAGARMITIDQVSKWYGSAQVLKRCSTGVAKGEVVVVCGPSGSGKSTLIKCVNGLEPFQEGAITVDGIAVGDRKTNLPKLRARIGMVFQHFELFPHLTVMRNLELAQIKVLGRSAGESAERGMRLLDRVGLREHAQKYPGQLSGGQQQRVAIARALAQRPAVILADEPTASLDPALTSSIMDILRTINREHGLTLVVSQHQLETALAYATRIVGFRQGRVAFDGPPAAVTPAVVREIYDE
jgi:glutamate/aspartate transport system ATP-binding protein